MIENFDKLINLMWEHGIQLLIIGLCTSWILCELIKAFKGKD